MTIQEMLNEINKLHLTIAMATPGSIQLEEQVVALMAIYDMYVKANEAEKLLASRAVVIPIRRKVAA